MARETGLTLKPLVRLGKRPDDCWEWLSVKTEGGYGKKQLGGKTLLAHRWMWTQLFGPIPDGLVIDHICANPGCVNPAHLRLCSQAENCRDGAGTTLTSADVVEIKQAKKTRGPTTANALALRYG
ncbi:MAG: HNH endonuclease, partial [Nevskiaceae bacterium]